MTAATLNPRLQEIVDDFASVGGTVGLERVNCWAMAEALGHAGPHRLQHFLSRGAWDHDLVRDRVMALVAGELADERAVFVIDETGDEKSSSDAVGAARQYSGALLPMANQADTVTVGEGRRDQGEPVRAQVDARLPPPAAIECVTAASEPGPHDGILTHPALSGTGPLYDRRHVTTAKADADRGAPDRPVPHASTGGSQPEGYGASAKASSADRSYWLHRHHPVTAVANAWTSAA